MVEGTKAVSEMQERDGTERGCIGSIAAKVRVERENMLA